MSITADIEKAAAKLQGDIDAAEFNLNGKKKTLAILQKECDQAEKALHKAKMAQYNARKAVVQKYIDDVLMKMKAPATYDPDRVKKLRSILASFKSSASYAKRIEILTAIRELQLILTAFPIATRVYNIIHEWTGSKFIKLSGDGKKIKFGDSTIFYTVERLDTNDHFLMSVCREYKYRYHLRFVMTEAHYTGTPMGHYHEFWESKCLAVPLAPDIVIGEAPDDNDGKKSPFDFFGDTSYDKYDLVKIGTELFRRDDSPFSAEVAWIKKEEKIDITVTDADWASNLIALNPQMFSVKEVMCAYERLSENNYRHCADSFHHARSHVDFIVERITKELQKCAPKTVRDIKFDADLMAITWRDPYDKDMAFDPDTCEMQHPSKVIHKLDVSNVRLSNVCMYAYKHIEGMAKPEKDI